MATGMHQHCDCARFLFHGASQLSVAHLVCLAGMEVLSNKTMRTRGSVRKHGSAWRAQVQLAGASVNGPTRQSKTLAKADLEAARAASSNDEMRDKLEKLRKDTGVTRARRPLAKPPPLRKRMRKKTSAQCAQPGMPVEEGCDGVARAASERSELVTSSFLPWLGHVALDVPVLHHFWDGGTLTTSMLECIRSYSSVCVQFLWVYTVPNNVPRCAIVRPADNVVSDREFRRWTADGDADALGLPISFFEDFFAFCCVYMHGGWWGDLDVHSVGKDLPRITEYEVLDGVEQTAVSVAGAAELPLVPICAFDFLFVCSFVCLFFVSSNDSNNDSNNDFNNEFNHDFNNDFNYHFKNEFNKDCSNDFNNDFKNVLQKIN